MRTSRYNIVYAWDREGQSNIVEIAKKDPDRSHLNGLNIDVFLIEFEKWKAADLEQKPSLYASLREMHQAAGINKASTVFGADAEMLAFGNYVSRVKESQQNTQAAITEAKPSSSIDITSPDTLNPQESIVRNVPLVAPKEKKLKKERKIPKGGVQKPLVVPGKSESNGEEKIDFSAEQKSLQNILQEVEKSSKLEYFSKFGNSKYRGESIDAIDYALQEQNDTEFYVYDKPKDGERLVYRTDVQNSIIDIVKVKMNNEVTVIKGSLFKPTYIPIILGTK